MDKKLNAIILYIAVLTILMGCADSRINKNMSEATSSNVSLPPLSVLEKSDAENEQDASV